MLQAGLVRWHFSSPRGMARISQSSNAWVFVKSA
jgi:hypothetical protein